MNVNKQGTNDSSTAKPAAKQVLPNLLTLEVRSSIDFAWKKQNQSRR
jgi:hypothetical protein